MHHSRYCRSFSRLTHKSTGTTPRRTAWKQREFKRDHPIASIIPCAPFAVLQTTAEVSVSADIEAAVRNNAWVHVAYTNTKASSTASALFPQWERRLPLPSTKGRGGREESNSEVKGRLIGSSVDVRWRVGGYVRVAPASASV
eukprot:6190103-Pleurochrysis_carterae.AAC.3